MEQQTREFRFCYDRIDLHRYANSTSSRNGSITTIVNRKAAKYRSDLEIGDCVIFTSILSDTEHAGQICKIEIDDREDRKYYAILWGNHSYTLNMHYKRGKIVELDPAFVTHIIPDTPGEYNRYCCYNLNHDDKYPDLETTKKEDVVELYEKIIKEKKEKEQKEIEDHKCEECMKREKDPKMKYIWLIMDERVESNKMDLLKYENYQMYENKAHLTVLCYSVGNFTKTGGLWIPPDNIEYLPHLQYKNTNWGICRRRLCKINPVFVVPDYMAEEMIEDELKRHQAKLDDFINKRLFKFTKGLKSFAGFNREYDFVFHDYFVQKKKKRVMKRWSVFLDSKNEEQKYLWDLYLVRRNLL